MPDLTSAAIHLNEAAVGALVLALLTAGLSLLGWLGLSILKTLTAIRRARQEKQDAERHLKEVLVDVIIDADFAHESITDIIAPTNIDAVKATIKTAPDDYRAFVVSVKNDPTFTEYRGIRRQLDIPLMAACDRYFDLSQLFTKYYDTLGTPQFAQLDRSRKLGALDNLCDIGRQTQDAYANLSHELTQSHKSRKIAQEVITFLKTRSVTGGTAPGDQD